MKIKAALCSTFLFFAFLANAVSLEDYEKTLKLPDSDQKFSKLYEIDSSLASRIERFSEKSESLRKYVKENPARFQEWGEPFQDVFSTTDFWIKKIENKKHPAIGEYEYQNLSMKVAYLSEGGIEDAKAKEKVISLYSQWLKRFPKHSRSNEAKKELEATKRFKLHP